MSDLKLAATVFVFLAIGIVFAGCGASAIGEASTGNVEVSADLIATVDGCKIYRLSDGASNRKIYFAKCENHSSTAMNYQCGKNCVDNPIVANKD